MTERRNINKLCDSLLNSGHLTTAAILHGRQNESTARKKFEEVTGLSVSNCGLFIREDLPFLAASPDGLVGDDSVIEIKCPYKGKDEKIKPGPAFPFLCMMDNNLQLDNKHKYYDQVQGQLFLSRRSVCFFFVYTCVDHQIIKVPLDNNYVSLTLIPKLTDFYQHHFRPYIASTM